MKDIGNEYGTALFLLACENDKMKEYGKALTEVAAAFEEEAAYFEFLKNPAIPARERGASLTAVFENALPEEVLSFLLLLCDKGRMPIFFEAFKSYKALLDAAEHVANAHVTSAVELTAEEKVKLLDKLKTVSRSDVVATYAIDASLLGGLIIEIDGKIIDGSLRHRLSEIKGVINNE